MTCLLAPYELKMGPAEQPSCLLAVSHTIHLCRLTAAVVRPSHLRKGGALLLFWSAVASCRWDCDLIVSHCEEKTQHKISKNALIYPMIINLCNLVKLCEIYCRQQRWWWIYCGAIKWALDFFLLLVAFASAFYMLTFKFDRILNSSKVNSSA